jgi:hypothetical protein
MFDGKKYLTRGVDRAIPLEVQIFMWQCIDNLKVEKDYLQVFDLSVENGMQRVVHKQEVPEYRNSYTLSVSRLVHDVRVFVIDDGEYSTMLLAEEY